MEPLLSIRIKDTHPDIVLRGSIGDLVQRMIINGPNETKIPVWWITALDLEVEADSIEEAINKAPDLADINHEQAEYADGTLTIDVDGAYELAEEAGD